MASTNSPGHGGKGRLPGRRRSRLGLLSALTVALLAVSISAVWFIARSPVTVGQAAAAQLAPTEETPKPQKPEEASFWSKSTNVNVRKHVDRAPVELGMRFTAAQNGWVAGVRFYKADGEKGRHTGSLWNSDGRRLGRVVFAEESKSGWQEARFASPVRLQAKQVYTVSYHSANGTYVGSTGFKSARSGPLTTTSRDVGVFGYGDSAFPRRSNAKGYNYWVDVIFRWRDRGPRSWVTRSPEPGPSVTPSSTTSPKGTPNATPSTSGTASPNSTPTQGASSTATSTATASSGPTPTQSATPTASNTATAGSTATASASTAPSPTSTQNPSPSPTSTHSADPSPSRSSGSGPTFIPNPTLGPVPDGGCAAHPTPACTGVPKGTVLSQRTLNEDNAAYRVKNSGMVLDGVHIRGDLLIHAHDVIVRNSQIDGHVVNADGDKTFRFTITDSTVGPAQGCETLPGVGQDQYTATRVHVRGHSDGFRASGDDIVIKDSYVHLCSRSGDHSDGIQAYKTGKGLVFDHNTVDQRDAKHATAPIFLVDDQIVDASVTDNLVMGGTYSIQLKNARGELIMRNNKLVDKSWLFGPVEADCTAIDWAGNSLVTIDRNYRITSVVGPLECDG